MAKIDLARRAEIGREKRVRTRAQIVEAGLVLLAERPPEALTVDAIVEAAGLAKGTFYYHFQSIEELVAAVGGSLADSFDALLAPSLLGEPDPIVRMSLAFTKFLEKAINDPLWSQLVVRSAQVPAGARPHTRTSRGGPCRGDRPGKIGHTGRGAGGRYRHRYLASGHARQY